MIHVLHVCVFCTALDGCFVTENDNCGNGIVDDSETCDCGRNCDADTCCDAASCTLATGSGIACRCV